MKKLFYCIFAFIFIFSLEVKAQDAHLTQYFSAPLLLNPAMAGNTGQLRTTFNYRDQWRKMPANYKSYLISSDIYLPTKGIGLGAIIKKDDQGTNIGKPFSKYHFSAIGSYYIPISKYKRVVFGLEAGYSQQVINTTNFIFGDQLDDFGFIGKETMDPLATVNKKGYANFSSGIMYYTEWFWASVSYKHMNQPNVSFSDYEQVKLPATLSISAGYVIPLEHRKYSRVLKTDARKSLTLTGLYYKQGKADQMTLGAYLHYYPIMIGAWYRGMPFIKQNAPDMINQDAVAFLSGIKLKNLTLGYSYDVTVSKLPQNRAASHELSLSYVFDVYKNYRKKPKSKALETPCPIPWM